MTNTHRVALVRPGPASLGWLMRTIDDVQADDPLQPVTVVAPSPYVAALVRQHLAESGSAAVQCVVQLRPLAERIGRACGSRAFDHPLTGPLESAAIRVAAHSSGGDELRPLADNRALHESLGALFRELGHLDQDAPALERVVGSGSIGAAAGRSYRTFAALTRDFPDVPQQLRIAARLLSESDGWDELGGVVVYLPDRLDSAENELLAELARHVPVHVALAWFEDDEAGASIEKPDEPALWPSVHVLSAPDPEEETRAVVRRMLADMEAGVPLWRMAMLYTSDEPYASLVRETLDAARVPWHAALGRPAAAGLAARSLLALLGLRQRNFAREAVLDWVAARPVLPEAADDPLPVIPISAWDRLSRRAQVLQGAEQWIARFERLITTLEAEEQRRLDWHAEALVHESEADVPHPPNDLDHARAILSAMTRLDLDTRPPTEPADWGALVDWAARLRSAYVRDDPDWPEAEHAAAEALDEVLVSLRQASALEPVATLVAFHDALESALEARRLTEGRVGVGVLVAPLGSSTGAAFDRSFVLGAVEGALPTRPSADPFTAGTADQPDPFGRRERQRSNERQAFLGAPSSVGERGSVLLSFPRTDGANRASHPSRWVLEQVARVEGQPTAYASDLQKLFGPQRPWLERIDSAYDGLRRASTALHVSDLQLREVVRGDMRGQGVSELALAARPDLVLGRALRAARARRSQEFTEFDGNLAAIAAESERIARPFAADAHGSSATSLERWAECPYRYFLANVLRVESTEHPEEEWTITPLDRGSLIHQVLEVFFRERFEHGRSTPDEPYGPADHARLEAIATLLVADLEAQGRTGHAVAWENARASLLRDLHLQLDREEVWRLDEGLAPALFERTFGDMRDVEGWPAVELDLGDGRVVRFRGAIDRIDVSASRVLVIDYKSGSTWGYDNLDTDPVSAGRHLQLVLYGLAARTNPVSAAEAAVRAEFRFVSSRARFERRQIVVDTPAVARLSEVVRHAADGIGAGAFLPLPGEYDRGTFRNCRYCEFDRICSASRDREWQRKSPRTAFVPLEPPA